jgi:preprotein translocase subunit SecF
MQMFANSNFNFIRWRWHALALSALVVIAGVVLIAMRGLPLGIDFSGGTLIVVQFERDTTEEQVRSAVASLPGDEIVLRYDDPAKRQFMIRLPQVEGMEQGTTSLEQGARQVEEALMRSGLPKSELIKRELVGPSIGADLQRRGIYAVLTSLLAITVYIGIRFRFSFAVGAIAATFHDVLVTVAFLVFFGYDLSLNVVAAILTITGYSVNDTIVIFDRVRENLRAHRRQPLEQVVNLSVNQTLGRTIITAGTTFLSVLSLYVFGGEALSGFAFTMMVGIISGTYSTVFIASAIAIILSKKGPVAGATAKTADVVKPAVTKPAVSKKSRRATAS